MSSSNPKSRIGTVIANRYRVQEGLGSGTMGTVYRAEHIHMKKTYAIKILHSSHVRDPEVVERFQREAQAAANIDHPNVCTATDFGRHDDETYFLVMEYLDGRSLHEAITDEEPFSQLRVVHLVKQMCGALDRAHELGVVHRDLKPENILLIAKDNDPDFVKITDFGVAQVRLFKDAARLTQAGVVYGSPLYMSPEQASGKEVDHRADLYSVGIILYELLTGQLPFYAKSLTVVLNMHLSDPPKPFREANPFRHIDPELEEITLKLLAKKRDERYQSANELYAALEHAEIRIRDRGEPSASLKKAPNEESGSLFKAGLMSIGVILLGILIVWGAWTVVDLNHQSSTDERSQLGGKKTKAERDAYIKQTPAVQKAILAGNRDGQKSVDAFEALLKQDAKNPHLRYLLGHQYLANGDLKNGFAEFRTLLSVEPTYSADAELLDDIVRPFESSKSEEHKAAEKFIREHLKSSANGRLGVLAEHHRSRKVRKRALSLLKSTKQFDSLAAWHRLTIELRHASGCENNQALIVKIGELGDPRALSALQRFDALPKDRCGGKDCWACLRGDLRTAIDHLKARQGVPQVSAE